MSFELDLQTHAASDAPGAAHAKELASGLLETIEAFRRDHPEVDREEIAQALELVGAGAAGLAPDDGAAGRLALPTERMSQRAQVVTVILAIMALVAVLGALFLIRRP